MPAVNAAVMTLLILVTEVGTPVGHVGSVEHRTSPHGVVPAGQGSQQTFPPSYPLIHLG